MARRVPFAASVGAATGKGVDHASRPACRLAVRDAVGRATVAGEGARSGGNLRTRRAAAYATEEDLALLALPFAAAAITTQPGLLPKVGAAHGALAGPVPCATRVAVAMARHRRGGVEATPALEAGVP